MGRCAGNYRCRRQIITLTEKRLKKYLIDLFSTTSEKLPYLKEIDYVLSVPNQKSHGDYAINAEMILSKKLKILNTTNR